MGGLRAWGVLGRGGMAGMAAVGRAGGASGACCKLRAARAAFAASAAAAAAAPPDAAASTAVPAELIRNFGISAHVDSGKTTMTERILFYTGRIAKMHEIATRVGATMDHMELEREKGITIQSAATHAKWDYSDRRFHLNVIDTPGHVDFQIEVERSLRVLDGAIFIVCGLRGVQSQSYTVDRQMRRYQVPRIIFINKLDREGADPESTVASIRKNLKINAAPIQVPLGVGRGFGGLVDLVDLRLVRNLGDFGELREFHPLHSASLPTGALEEVQASRQRLVEAVAEKDEEFADHYLTHGDVGMDVAGDGRDEDAALFADKLRLALRRGTLQHAIVPCLFGSAKRNYGVQDALDAVCAYLPHAGEPVVEGLRPGGKGEEPVALAVDPLPRALCFAFKIQELPHVGSLVYVKIYQGTLRRGLGLYEAGTGRRVPWKKMFKMHANQVEEVFEARAGDIVALSGVAEVATGATLAEDASGAIRLRGIEVPETVISAAVHINDSKQAVAFAKACRRFEREDPTFKFTTDLESKEQLLHGMGELHLDIYRERILREYGVKVTLSPPRVNLREASGISGKFHVDYMHRRQHGGRGEWARIVGHFEPVDPTFETLPPCVFENDQVGSGVPPQFVTSVRKGFFSCVSEGRLTGSPIVNLKFVLTDGSTHEVDSNDAAFRNCMRIAFERHYADLDPFVLEPCMRVEATVPRESAREALTAISARGVAVTDSTEFDEVTVYQAEAPLRLLFGFISVLRQGTKGRGEFTMQFDKYAPMPAECAEYKKVAEAHAAKLKARQALSAD